MSGRAETALRDAVGSGDRNAPGDPGGNGGDPMGLSHRDSLTLSSLSEPVLCVQRALPRLEGGSVEPQEIPLPPLPGEAETLLPLLGMRLLRMPLTAMSAPW